MINLMLLQVKAELRRKCTVQGDISERISGIGSVSDSLICAMRAVLKEEGADGAFVAAAISLPSVSELIDTVDGADPLLLHAVSCRRDRFLF